MELCYEEAPVQGGIVGRSRPAAPSLLSLSSGRFGIRRRISDLFETAELHANEMYTTGGLTKVLKHI